MDEDEESEIDPDGEEAGGDEKARTKETAEHPIPSSPPQGKGGKAKKTTDSLDQGGLPQSILDLYN